MYEFVHNICSSMCQSVPVFGVCVITGQGLELIYQHHVNVYGNIVAIENNGTSVDSAQILTPPPPPPHTHTHTHTTPFTQDYIPGIYRSKNVIIT